jgi:hypothetical protein
MEYSDRLRTRNPDPAAFSGLRFPVALGADSGVDRHEFEHQFELLVALLDAGLCL